VLVVVRQVVGEAAEQRLVGLIEVEGNYPSKRSKGERAFWIRDSENNLLGIGQPLPLDS
jgi:hypothetical protein